MNSTVKISEAGEMEDLEVEMIDKGQGDDSHHYRDILSVSLFTPKTVQHHCVETT